MSNNLTTIIVALLTTLGAGGVLALFVVPAPKRFDKFSERLEKLEKEVAELRYTNRFLTVGVTVLSSQCDMYADMLTKLDPNLRPKRSSELLQKARADVDALERSEKEVQK